MKKYIYFLLLFTGISFSSCEKFLEPNPTGDLTEEDILFNPSFAEGLLMSAYAALPDDYDFATDAASDDAVTNVKGSVYTSMATGDWRSSLDPISKWEYAYEQIYYINKFLSIYESVIWSRDPNLSQEDNDMKNSLHIKRLKGEALGLRAWYKWQLLQYHGGKAADGQLLGFPIIDELIESGDDWELPRNSFADCVQSTFKDIDSAIANLPATWAKVSDPIINATSGSRFENRLSGNAAKALKSRVALLAASPAFSEANVVTWAEAAQISGSLLTELGSLYAGGTTFYKTFINAEIIWNRSEIQKRSWEESNMPPSFFGNGNTNPSQNLVDAFPMANGYPITVLPQSGYDASDPYANRDPRFSDYIFYNGSKFKTGVINTYIDAEMDGINALETSTRSGYYLKKLMSDKVNLNPGTVVNAGHTYTLFRETEVLLNFAEAANEAWGPDGDDLGLGFTARSKIAELRSRAGLSPDDYLATVITKDDFRKLIQNERRIELCFEGFRFWDIRRWELPVLNDPVKGALITSGSDTTYSYVNIEDRNYSSYMIYGPIPYRETLKYGIVQNEGW